MRTVRSIVSTLSYISLTLVGARVSLAQAGSARSAFAPLTLGPAPSQTRLANGSPGPKYWQNRADYYIRAILDTVTYSLRGSMTLRYTNNSPDALDVLWIQTERDPKEKIDRFVQSVNGTFVPVKQLENHDTETKVTLAKPIKPGETAIFQVAWQFTMNAGDVGAKRPAARVYLVTLWYPRVNVYDDVKGWNTESYRNGGEFFLEYGDYVMEVTVPASYIVAATGTLDNPSEVLTPTEISRLAVAAKSDTVVRIVTAEELTSGAARPTQSGMLTWKFHSNNVRDAIWCASPDYQWDAIGWHGILAQAYYRPIKADGWNEGADMARMSIQEYSERWLPYPYPQASAVQISGDGGMEYPMLSMAGALTSKRSSIYEFVTHEVGHNWFPMIVGSNERMHTWMDEGFNQFINTFSEARRYPQGGDQKSRAQNHVRWIEEVISNGNDKVLETGKFIGNDQGQYSKTAGVLQMLRLDVMGPDVFDKGLRTYIQRWAYKHPTPVDFFRTMSDVAGHNLDWFWREWFLEAPKFDQAIDSVSSTTDGKETKITVMYGNKADGVLPLLVRFTFSDSTKQDFKYPAEIWAKGTTYTVSYTFSGKTVTKVTIDPDRHLVDIRRDNNSWAAK